MVSLTFENQRPGVVPTVIGHVRSFLSAPHPLGGIADVIPYDVVPHGDGEGPVAVNRHVGLPGSNTCGDRKLETSVRRVRPWRDGRKEDGRALTQPLVPPRHGEAQGRGGADVVEGADFQVVGGVGEDERDLTLRGLECLPGGLS